MGYYRPGIGRSTAVGVVANDWWDHHDSCAICRPSDYIDPGAPLLIERKNSVEVIEAPDLSVLCPTGVKLFRAWVRVIPKVSFATKKASKKDLEEVEGEES